ncbi:MAG: hypothetical protein WC551_12200 [Patescibacteria group bacterium]
METKSVQACLRPFSSNDFEALDKVADGKLYLSELGEGNLDCLAQHLIRTKDSELRDNFRSFIQNDVWEALKARLKALKKSGGLDDDVSQRLDDLLAKEYSDDEIIVSGSSRYKLNSQQTGTVYAGAKNGYQLETHSLALNAQAKGNFNIETWKVAPLLSVTGEQLWSNELNVPAEGDVESIDHPYRGGGGEFNASILRRDEAVKMFGYGYLYKYNDPPPYRTENYYGAGGSLQLRDIGDTALSLKASADWYLLDYTPLAPDYFDPIYRDLSIYGEAAYMFDRTGVLATYEHRNSDYTDPGYKSFELAHSGSLLAHFKIGEGYLRAGAGGGYWEQEILPLGSEESASQGSEIHAKILGDLKTTDILHLNFSLQATANQSDGTFIGWYPSGVASLGATLILGDLSIEAGGNASGDRRDINLSQKNYSFGGTASIAYAPTDYFNVSTNGDYSVSRTIGYSAMKRNEWSWGAKVAFRVLKDLDIWLTTQGDLSSYDFSYEDGYGEQYRSATLIESLSIKY